MRDQYGRTQHGFTLIEAIVAITLTAILAGMVAVFIRWPVEGYAGTVRRANLAETADMALRRLGRDARTALPNSLRQTDGSCIEFLPTAGGGRYRETLGSSGNGDILDFSKADASFDVLAGANLPDFSKATYHVVVYNLGIPGADAYDASNNNRAQIKSTSSSSNIALVSNTLQFARSSPNKRFLVIPDYSVVYSCAGGQLLRTTRAITAAQYATGSCPTAGTALVGNVDCTSSSFGYIKDLDLLTVVLVLTDSGESARIYQEIHVNNAP